MGTAGPLPDAGPEVGPKSAATIRLDTPPGKPSNRPIRPAGMATAGFIHYNSLPGPTEMMRPVNPPRARF